MKGKPLVLAHRCGPRGAPENTVAAARLAFARGAHGVECDVRRTADGEFVLMHDASAARVTGFDWPVEGTAWAHLKHLRVGGTEPVAHLDDMLKLAAAEPRKLFYFEMCFRSGEDAAALGEKLASSGLAGRCRVLAFAGRAELLRAARAAAPGLGTAVMPYLPYDPLLSARRAGADEVCCGWLDWPGTRLLFKGAAAAFGFRRAALEAAEAGIMLSAGIANGHYDVRWLAEQGVGGIWTDDAHMASRCIYGG